MKAPKGAKYIHDGIYYKKGVHNFVFRFHIDKWVRSSKAWAEVIGGKHVKRGSNGF